MKRFKKLICFLLVFVFLFNNFIVVQASSVTDEEKQKYDQIYGEDNWFIDELGMPMPKDYLATPEQSVVNVMNFLGTFVYGMDGFNFSSFAGTAQLDVTKDKIKELLGSGDIKVKDDKLEVSEKAAEELHKSFYDLAIPLNGYYLVEPTMTLDDMRNLYTNSSHIDAWNTFISSYSSFYINYDSSWGTSYYDFIPILSEGYYYINQGYVNRSDGTVDIQYPMGVHLTKSGNSYESRALKPSINGGTYVPRFHGYVGTPFKIFYSMNDLTIYLNQLKGQDSAKIYISSNFFNYSPQSYNIDLNKYLNTDWGGLNISTGDKINATIQQTVADKGEALTPEEMQQIIDNAVKELQDSINGSGGGDNPGGDDNPGGGEADLSTIEEWLSKIYGLVEKFKVSTETNFKELIKAVQDIGNLGSDESFLDKLLGLIGDAISTAAGNILSDLINLFIGEDGNLLDGITNSASALATQAQSKFPTCIPWDVVMILGYFDAEPQAPKIEFPFKVESAGIDETISIDFSKMEPLAKLSRSMLTVTFLLFLVVQTRKLYGALNDSGGD